MSEPIVIKNVDNPYDFMRMAGTPAVSRQQTSVALQMVQTKLESGDVLAECVNPEELLAAYPTAWDRTDGDTRHVVIWQLVNGVKTPVIFTCVEVSDASTPAN